jgi:putative tricarboxylic transport membrane protein
MTRSKDVVTGLVTIGLAIFLFAISSDVKDFAAVGVGAGFLPRLAAVLLGVLGILLAVDGWRQVKRTAGRAPLPSDTGTSAAADEVQVFGGGLAVLLSVGLMCAYVALLQSLGFVLASSLYAFLQMLILAKNTRKNLLQFGAVAFASSAIAYFLFVRIFQVMLPAGVLG